MIKLHMKQVSNVAPHKLEFYTLDVEQELKFLGRTVVRAIATSDWLGPGASEVPVIVVMKPGQSKEQALRAGMAITIDGNCSVNLKHIKIPINDKEWYDVWAEPVSYFTEYQAAMRELQQYTEQPWQTGAPVTDEPAVQLSMRM
tara:strand:+ start:305 stop:736 length:432 start_codon:yes stop_codon:yes gene_type:complete